MKMKIKEITKYGRGPEFAMAGAGKNGLMQKDQKGVKIRKSRREAKIELRKNI